jgi:membrane protein
MQNRWLVAWRAVRRVQARASRNRLTLLAAGVAFYALLSLVPGLVALISIYALLFDPADVQRQMLDALDGAPDEVRTFVASQMADIAARDSGTAITSIVIGIVVALWSASGGMGHLLAAIDAARGGIDRRHGVHKRGAALVVTIVAIGYALVLLAILTFVPTLLASLDLAGEIVLRPISWVLLVMALVVGLNLLYRVGPARSGRPWFHVSRGVVVAVVLWSAGSIGFSIYTANFSSYNETYGSLAAVVVVMLWLFISAYAIILGAEVNADVQRRRDAHSVAEHDEMSEGGELLLAAEDDGEGIARLTDSVDHVREQPTIGP